jgi:hypothetical protein
MRPIGLFRRATDIICNFFYDAPRLTTINLNGTELVAVPSKELAEFNFGIWLGVDKPINEKLRDPLLSGSGRSLAKK